MTVSFVLAKQPSEGPHMLWFFALIAAMYLTIIMNRSSNKQIYRLYFILYVSSTFKSL